MQGGLNVSRKSTLLKNVMLYYYPDENAFKTSENQIVFLPCPLVDADRVHIFRYYKKSMTFVNWKYGIRVILLYPTAG